MKIALTHYYEGKKYFILEKENMSLQKIISNISKVILIESHIDESSYIGIEKVSDILVKHFKFISNLEEYNDVDIPFKIKKIRVRQIPQVQKNIPQNTIYEVDLCDVWEWYLCCGHDNFLKETKEMKEIKIIYQYIYDLVLLDRTEFYNDLSNTLEENYKKVGDVK